MPSLSPKVGHNKASRSDFLNQRFEPDRENAENAEGPFHLTKQGSEETPQRGKRGKYGHENVENAENASDWL